MFDVVNREGLTYITPKKKYERDYANIESIRQRTSREEDGKYAVIVANIV